MKKDERAKRVEILLSDAAPVLRSANESMEQGDWDGVAEESRRLGDLNSSFPETRRFLQERGLSHVRELDAAGMRELKAVLLETYRKFSAVPTGIPS